jgi:hypothetical protein
MGTKTKNLSYSKRFTKFVHHYKRRLVIFGMFSTGFLALIPSVRRSESEVLRMAMAGSISNTFCEVALHFVDTVNIRTKVYEKNVSTYHMFSTIVSKEGIYGLSKGISACFYGSVICGFVYYSLYRMLKKYFVDTFGD